MSASPLLSVQPEDVLTFWREAGPSRWFRKDEDFDREFRARFLAAHDAAMRGDLDAWSQDHDSVLALLILLDQFPRNAFRGTPRMFESDSKALEIARLSRSAGYDKQAGPELRNFFYLPFMHSEDLADQDLGVELARGLGDDPLRWALVHHDIIQKFGRFPHRNDLLGRTTTPEEQRFLDEGGFAG